MQRFLPELLGHIESGRLHPAVIISHRMPLAEAANGYKIFEEKEDGCPQGCPKAIRLPEIVEISF